MPQVSGCGKGFCFNVLPRKHRSGFRKALWRSWSGPARMWILLNRSISVETYNKNCCALTLPVQLGWVRRFNWWYHRRFFLFFWKTWGWHFCLRCFNHVQSEEYQLWNRVTQSFIFNKFTILLLSHCVQSDEQKQKGLLKAPDEFANALFALCKCLQVTLQAV